MSRSYASGFLAMALGALLAMALPTSARAGGLLIADYGGAFSNAFLDTDPSHVYVTVPASDPCWTSAACLGAYDVIAVGISPNPATALADLGNATVAALVGNAVISDIWHGHGEPGDRDSWTNAIEFAGAGAGVGMVMSADYSGQHSYTPFAPGVPLTTGSGLCNQAPVIVDSAHPVVTTPTPLTNAALTWFCTTHAVFNVVPPPFQTVVIDGVTGQPILIATPSSVCGDGVIGIGEQCDDGNTTSGDCCSSTCQAEAGNACDDGDACTTGDTCSVAGTCVGGAPPDCSDGDVCTDDLCDALSGCFNPFNTAPCDDGNGCTSGDACDGAGSCVGQNDNSIDGCCEGLLATIVGTPGNDSLFGTPGPDIIAGGAGNDSISAKGGDDIVCGGAGDDSLNGQSGNDLLVGDEGSDSLKGGLGNDTLVGGADDDSLFGAGGNDELDGSGGNDRLFGEGGNDVLEGGDGDDLVDGGGGADSVSGGAGDDTVRGAAGDDGLDGGTGADALDGGGDTDVCDGGVDADPDTARRCETELNVP